MSIRRVRGSFRDPSAQRRHGTASSSDSCHRMARHSTWLFRNDEWRLLYDDGEEVSIMSSKHERVSMKDFGSEVRATLDITHFLHQAVLLLDVTETSLEGVVELMLHKMLGEEEPLCTAEEAKSVLFTDNSGHLLARTMQGTCRNTGGSSFDYDQSWVCALCDLPTLQRRHVAIARLRQPANFGRTIHDVRLFVLVICPSKEKGTKNALEMGRTFCTILADIDFRQILLDAHTELEFKRLVLKHTNELAQEQTEAQICDIAIDQGNSSHEDARDSYEERLCSIGRGVCQDFLRRLPHYKSDFTDGWTGPRTKQKVLSTSLFLYFACILPAIAFGVLNDHNTKGKIGVKKVIFGQIIGGLFYSFASGQPLLILLTTAPLAIYIKIIYSICEDFNLDFFAIYCCVGLWNTFFLTLYAVFDVSRIMHWSTRSTEEIFALFISAAYFVDVIKDIGKDFYENYFSDACGNMNPSARGLPGTMISQNISSHGSLADIDCHRERSILCLLLTLGTFALSVILYNFNKTPYLQASKREILADYALPTAVLVLSFVGSYFFRAVDLEHFTYDAKSAFDYPDLQSLSWPVILGCMALGFSLSLLFFMDQNITSAIVNNPCNKLKKGPAYHLDLLVVAILNGVLSVFGIPWMHATLPHSPMHIRGLADVEERVDQGHVYEIIVKVRETRLTSIIAHLLIAISIFLLPYPLAYIPTAVLEGLFLYMGVITLEGNQMFDRITLMFMEQSAYPPNHYIRRVPQRRIHTFTACQVFQLFVMCVFGFSPWAYLKVIFPFIILLLMPIRHKLIPLFIESRYLEALDGEHQ